MLLLSCVSFLAYFFSLEKKMENEKSEFEKYIILV